MVKKNTVLITTKNRKKELALTLEKIQYLLDSNEVCCIICDDGSTDGTSQFIKTSYPNIQLIRNSNSRGLIYSRNRLLNLVQTDFAISLDDDANFILENPLEIINNHFEENSNCGLIALRIFWGVESPIVIHSNETFHCVKGFVGCGHVWNMKAWKSIQQYPEWFIFYGEEDFAAFQLFKKGWEIHYVPQILVHHRVNLKARKKEKDYRLRLRRSLRSGWYLYFMFYPWKLIPRRMIYTIWIQVKIKVLKGDWKAGIAIIQAIGDVIINMPRLLNQSNRLSIKEFKKYQSLEETKLFWFPKK